MNIKPIISLQALNKGTYFMNIKQIMSLIGLKKEHAS